MRCARPGAGSQFTDADDAGAGEEAVQPAPHLLSGHVQTYVGQADGLVRMRVEGSAELVHRRVELVLGADLAADHRNQLGEFPA